MAVEATPYRVCIDPGLLVARDPAAMLALLLADEVYTALPCPTRQDHLQLVLNSPEYSASKTLLNKAGPWLYELAVKRLITCRLGDDDVLGHIAAIVRVLTQPTTVHLGAMSGCARAVDEPSFFEWFARSSLEGVPYSFPVAAGLEHFSRLYGVAMLKGAADTPTREQIRLTCTIVDEGIQTGYVTPELVEQIAACSRSTRPTVIDASQIAMADAMPILRRATPQQLVDARGVLSDVLHPLRVELASIMATCEDLAAVRTAVDVRLRPHLREYRTAFASRAAQFTAAVRGSERELSIATVSVVASIALGIPALNAALAGAIAAAGTVALRQGVIAAEQAQKRRTHLFGFLAYLEDR